MAARALFLAVLLACCSVASAMTLDDLSPGKTVHGPNLSLKEMKGKVVFVLYWGTH